MTSQRIIDQSQIVTSSIEYNKIAHRYGNQMIDSIEMNRKKNQKRKKRRKSKEEQENRTPTTPPPPPLEERNKSPLSITKRYMQKSIIDMTPVKKRYIQKSQEKKVDQDDMVAFGTPSTHSRRRRYEEQEPIRRIRRPPSLIHEVTLDSPPSEEIMQLTTKMKHMRKQRRKRLNTLVQNYHFPEASPFSNYANERLHREVPKTSRLALLKLKHAEAFKQSTIQQSARAKTNMLPPVRIPQQQRLVVTSPGKRRQQHIPRSMSVLDKRSIVRKPLRSETPHLVTACPQCGKRVQAYQLEHHLKNCLPVLY